MGIPPPHDAAAPFFAFLLRSMPYLWGIGFGVAFAGTVLGWDFVTGDSLVVRQVAGDNAAGLAAFRAYLDDGWRWPILSVPSFGEGGVNVAFSDSIPLLALAAKLLRPLGVPAESWWGGWFAFAYALQGAGAIFAVRSWGARTVFAHLAAPVLALSMPVLLLQTVHPSLSAHGLLLVGWGFAGRARSGSSLPTLLCGLLALVVAAFAIHPYVGLMVGVMAVGVVGDAVVGGRLRFAVAAVWVAGLAAAVGIWAFVGGYLDASGPSDGGYGRYATSVFGPFVPTLSSLIAGEPTGFEIQPSHPGYAYLGLGTAGLATAATVVQRRRLVGLVRSNQLVAVAMLALTVWAVSPWVRLATGEVIDLPTALAFRLGSPRRAGAAVSLLGIAAALAALAVVALAARRGGFWPRGDRVMTARRSSDYLAGLGGFSPAISATAVVALGVCAVGLVSPDGIGMLMSQFRASGRFAWPVLYGLLTLAVAAVDPTQLARAGGGASTPSSAVGHRPRRTWTRGTRTPQLLSIGLLVTAAMIQIADTATLRRFAHELLVPGGVERRDYVEVLVELVEAHDRVVLGPDFRCAYYPDGVGAFIDVTGAASAADRPIDRVYSARRPVTEPCSVPQTVDLSDPGALIVLVEPVAVLTDENKDEEIAERCRQRATLNLCSHHWDEVPPEVLAYFGPVAD